MRSCAILRSVELKFLTDVSGRPIGHIFKAQAAQEEFPETSVRKCNSPLRNRNLKSRLWINKEVDTEACADNSL